MKNNAANIFSQILQSIRYCNMNKISHRDLKPENFMFESAEEDSSKLKLIDFGLSKSYFVEDKVVRMNTYVGTPFYMSPEIIRGVYTESWDMWSAGVILYIMLSGYPPFYGETVEETLIWINKGEYDFDDEVWDQVSEEAKDLISRCFVEEGERITPKEALNHPWINQKEHVGKISTCYMDKLKDFQKAKRLKKAALTYLASRTSDSEIQKEMNLFSSLDKDKNGYITLKELKEGMKDCADVDEVIEILNAIDIDRNGAINYTEFIAATLSQKLFADEFKLKEIFNAFDKDKNGFIDVDDLKEIMEKERPEVLKEVISEIDPNGDSRISFEEFKEMMFNVHISYHPRIGY